MYAAVEEREAAAAAIALLSTAPSLPVAAVSAVTVAPVVPQQPQKILTPQSVVDGTYGLTGVMTAGMMTTG